MRENQLMNRKIKANFLLQQNENETAIRDLN